MFFIYTPELQAAPQQLHGWTALDTGIVAVLGALLMLYVLAKVLDWRDNRRREGKL